MIINIAEDGAALGVVLAFSASQNSSLVKNLKVEGRNEDLFPMMVDAASSTKRRRWWSSFLSLPARPLKRPAFGPRLARERERALPRSDFWVLSFGKSGSLKGNYTRKATDNGVGGDRAVFRRGREASSSCIAPLLFYKKGRNSSQRGRRGGRPRDRPEGKVDRDEGGREGSGRITSFNVGGGARWTFFCRMPFGETSPSAHSLPFYSRSGHFSAQKPVTNSL